MALETDIQVTKDGVFVLMNYATIDKVTTLFDPSKNKISDYTYYELCRMNFHANVSEIEKVIATSAAEFGDRATEYLEYYKELYSDLRYSKIATLEQLLSLPRHGKHLFIEIKTNYSKEEKSESIAYTKDLIDLLRKCISYR